MKNAAALTDQSLERSRHIVPNLQKRFPRFLTCSEIQIIDSETDEHLPHPALAMLAGATARALHRSERVELPSTAPRSE
jgi:hypothetical protein